MTEKLQRGAGPRGPLLDKDWTACYQTQMYSFLVILLVPAEVVTVKDTV